MDPTWLPDEPDEDAFRALARSSPWRWRTLKFTHREVWPGRTIHPREEVRAWLRRPDRLRVEQLRTGELLLSDRQGPQGTAWLTREGSQPRQPLLANDTAPTYRSDGLVAHRPSGIHTDAPLCGGYQWVAMLDPVELADGHDDQPSTNLTGLEASEQSGRPVWNATITPRDTYDPRCPCCPLLLHTETELPPPPEVERATAHHVRLDVRTGVCVHVRQIGGTHDGWYFDVQIDAVDAEMPEKLFPPQDW